MNSGINKFLLKAALFMLPILIIYETLFRLGFTPIITNSTPFDKKMLFLQQHPLKEVKLLAAGSSITFWSLDSRLIAENIHEPYYNFGSWSMTIEDTRTFLVYLVKRYHPDHVLIFSSFGDFQPQNNPAYLNYLQASPWVRDDFPELFYLTEFHSMHMILFRKMRSQYVNIDQWGGSWHRSENDWHPVPIKMDISPAQYAVLDTLCAFLQAQKIKLIFAQSPVKKVLLRTDSLRSLATDHFETCRQLVEKHGGAYFNYFDTVEFKDNLFIDSVHLNSEGAKIVTKKLVADLKTIVN
jgi:hypothetical protein